VKLIDSKNYPNFEYKWKYLYISGNICAVEAIFLQLMGSLLEKEI